MQIAINSTCRLLFKVIVLNLAHVSAEELTTHELRTFLFFLLIVNAVFVLFLIMYNDGVLYTKWRPPQ